MLPTSTRATVRAASGDFLACLRDLVGHVVDRMVAETANHDLVSEARSLRRRLRQIEQTAEARVAAEAEGPVADPALRHALRQVSSRIETNNAALEGALDDGGRAEVRPATELIEAARRAGDGAARSREGGGAPSALHYLGRIDQAIVNLARDLGAPSSEPNDQA